MSSKLKAYIALHFCVLIWGFTAILGKLISLQALPLVLWRVLLCCPILWFLIPKEQRSILNSRQLWQLFGIGTIVGLHWLGFYGAIKLANASVAVASLATTSFFTAIAEPLVLRQRFKWYELLLGLMILPGIVLIVGDLDWSMRRGFIVGIIAALLAAAFSVLNKKIVDQINPPPLLMSFVELGGVLALSLVILPFALLYSPDLAFWPQTNDWVWLAILAWVCTLLPYYLTLRALRHISIFATNLTINLEPVYGVLLAGILFQEHLDLNPRFYTGMGIILLAVFSHPFIKYRFEKR
jgi:drug/metabolite transporter (DMT)-like permease